MVCSALSTYIALCHICHLHTEPMNGCSLVSFYPWMVAAPSPFTNRAYLQFVYILNGQWKCIFMVIFAYKAYNRKKDLHMTDIFLLCFISFAVYQLQLPFCHKWLASFESHQSMFWLVNGLHSTHPIMDRPSTCSSSSVLVTAVSPSFPVCNKWVPPDKVSYFFLLAQYILQKCLIKKY